MGSRTNAKSEFSDPFTSAKSMKSLAVEELHSNSRGNLNKFDLFKLSLQNQNRRKKYGRGCLSPRRIRSSDLRRLNRSRMRYCSMPIAHSSQKYRKTQNT